MTTPKVQIINREAVIRMTADDWELYDRPGRLDAAREINTAIEQAVAKGCARRETEAAALAVMRKHEDLGALDSEGIWHLENILDKLYR
jgi:hypothetical protein